MGAPVAVRSMALVLLLLIHCLMHLPWFVGVLCWSLIRYALLYVLSNFSISLTRKRERAVFIVFWMSFYCKCPVALPHGAVGWSAVCGCGIS